MMFEGRGCARELLLPEVAKFASNFRGTFTSNKKMVYDKENQMQGVLYNTKFFCALTSDFFLICWQALCREGLQPLSDFDSCPHSGNSPTLPVLLTGGLEVKENPPLLKDQTAMPTPARSKRQNIWIVNRQAFYCRRAVQCLFPDKIHLPACL